MNTTPKTRNKDNITGNKEFLDILLPKSDKEKLEFEAQMIHLDFIARLQELMNYKNIKSKKELARLLDTTPSFISQLFSGEKLINLKHLTKLQRALGIKYAIISDQYLRHKNSFRGNLANKGYRELKINTKEIQTGYKKGA